MSHPPEVIRAAIEDAVQSLATGETTAQIAARHGLPKSTLCAYLIADPRADAARAALVGQQLTDAIAGLDDASNPLDLARAREQFRAWSWIGERRIPSMYGQKQEITHISLDLGDKLRRAKERVIEHESITVQPQVTDKTKTAADI